MTENKDLKMTEFNGFYNLVDENTGDVVFSMYYEKLDVVQTMDDIAAFELTEYTAEMIESELLSRYEMICEDS